MNPEEIWQVDAGGQIYEANFEELKQWVAEGAVLPSDKIRRGNLRWLEAGKIPLLHGVFNSRVSGNPPQIQTNVTHAAPINETPVNNFVNVITQEQIPIEAPPPPQVQTPPTPYSAEVKETHIKQDSKQTNQHKNNQKNQSFCSIHVTVEAKYICGSCKTLYCKECPETYGIVRICPNCRELCKSLAEVQQKSQQQRQYQKAITEGFGFGDFVKAIVYPFKHPLSLIIGCLMFAVFSIGLSGMRLGSMAVMGGSIVGLMLANMIAFACISNTINEFSKGNLTANFMPQFEDFNLWDDVIQPFFISIGVYTVSYGFLVIVILVGVFLAFNSAPTQNGMPINVPLAQLKQISNSSSSVTSFEELMQKDAEQKSKIAELKAGVKTKQDTPPQPAPPTLNQPQVTEAAQQPEMIFVSPEGEIMTAEQAQKMMGNSLEAQGMSKMPAVQETPQMMPQTMDSALVNYGKPLIILAFIALLWAIFYFPAACVVAGYTRNLNAVLNPLIGLDTIKQLGFSYIKILLMTFLLSVIAGLIFNTIGEVLREFDLPRIGNIPATFISSFISFYFCIVFAAILGYAFYKCKNLRNC